MASRSAIINVMARAAEKAARGLIRDFGEVEHLQVSRKGPADFVSTADTKAEQILRAELQKARPDFGFLLEEGGGFTGKDAGTRWIVDPLDGTTNFLHGLPFWSISIALEKEGEIVAGIVYEPVRDEMFWAEKGAGAWNNHQRLRVSGRRKLDESVIATGLPFKGRGNHADYLPQLQAVMAETAGVRRFGSAADRAPVTRWNGFGQRCCPVESPSSGRLPAVPRWAAKYPAGQPSAAASARGPAEQPSAAPPCSVPATG